MYFWTELRNKWLGILANQKERTQIIKAVKRMRHSFLVVLASSIGLSASRSSSYQHHTSCYLLQFLSSMISTKTTQFLPQLEFPSVKWSDTNTCLSDVRRIYFVWYPAIHLYKALKISQCILIYRKEVSKILISEYNTFKIQ